MSDSKQVIAAMTAKAQQQSTATLCEALTMLEAKPTLDEPERLTRAVLIDVLTSRHPEADAAFDAWAAGPTWMTAPAVEAITTAALAAAKGAEPETEPCLMCGEPSVPEGQGPLCERCEAGQDAEAARAEGK